MKSFFFTSTYLICYKFSGISSSKINWWILIQFIIFSATHQNSQIYNDEICFPFYLLSIQWVKVSRLSGHRAGYYLRIACRARRLWVLQPGFKTYCAASMLGTGMCLCFITCLYVHKCTTYVWLFNTSVIFFFLAHQKNGIGISF